MDNRFRSLLAATSVVLTCVAAALVPGLSSGLTSPSAAETAAGITIGTYENADIRALPSGRTFLVVKPQNYDSSRTYPVILAFAGWKITPEKMMRSTRIDREAPDAVVVYPAGIANAWAGAPYASTSIDQDLAFVRAIIGDVSTNYSGDKDTVFAVGHSNGGGMASTLACHAPELLDGVATVSGAFYNPTVEGCAPGEVPALLIHGSNDTLISFQGGVRHGVPYQGVETVLSTFGTRNSCDMSQLSSHDEGPATTVTPAGCLSPTRLVKVNGGTHSWPSSPSATTAVVTFFNSL